MSQGASTGMSRVVAAAILAGLLLPMLGCDIEPTQRRNVNAGTFGVDLGETSAPPPPAPAGTVPAPEQTGPPQPAQQPTAPPEPERVVAEAGVGVKGRKLGGSYLESVFASRFYIEQKLEFDKIKHAMNLYEAQHGEKPKSQEEFMEKIVKFNRIQLPRLPEGESYVYDPKTGDLMVERPR